MKREFKKNRVTIFRLKYDRNTVLEARNGGSRREFQFPLKARKKGFTDGKSGKKGTEKATCLLFCGFYGCGNLGDDALLVSLFTAIRSENPRVRLSYLSGGDERLSRMLLRAGIFAEGFSRQDPTAVLRAIAKSDCVVLGGGSVLQDKTGRLSLYYYTALLSTARRLGKKTAILAGGFGPIEKRCAVLTSAVRGLSYASFRDRESLAEARRFGLPDGFLSADPVLLISPTFGAISPSSGENLPPLPKRFFLVTLREKDRIAAVSAARHVVSISMKKNLTPVFCVLFPKEDAMYLRSVAREVSRLLREGFGLSRAAWTLPYLSPETLLAVTERAEYVLTARYHLALFAYAAGIPFSVLGDDPKKRAIVAESRSPSEAADNVREDVRRFLRYTEA